MTTALIDGDIVVYLAAAPAQRMLDWEDGEGATLAVDPEAAASAAVRIALDWTRKAGCHRTLVCLSDLDANFRKVLAPGVYKANRKAEKPLTYAVARQALVDALPTKMIAGLEADDVMGILHTAPKYAGDSVVVTLDKDLLGVPGTHFNPKTGTRPIRIKPFVADAHWMRQTLRGDAVDNIPGSRGVGPKKADAILADAPGLTLPSLWGVVADAYDAAGLTFADALLNARLTRILRRSDFDRENMEIALWHPTTPTRLALASVTTPAASGAAPAPRDASASSADRAGPSAATTTPSQPARPSSASSPAASKPKRQTATDRPARRKATPSSAPTTTPGS